MAQSGIGKILQDKINMKIAIIEGKLSDVQQEGAEKLAKMVKEIETAYEIPLAEDFTFVDRHEANDLLDHIICQADYHGIADSDITDAYDNLYG